MLGGVGIGQSLAGAGLCFLITLAGYHMSGRGAGDVKLAAVLGALLGIEYGVFAVAYSYIVAAVAIIVWSDLGQRAAGDRQGGVCDRSARCSGPLWPFPPSPSDTELLLRPIPSVLTLPSARCWWSWSWYHYGNETIHAPTAVLPCRRHGLASLEVIMTTAVMLPIAFAVLIVVHQDGGHRVSSARRTW